MPPIVRLPGTSVRPRRQRLRMQSDTRRARFALVATLCWVLSACGAGPLPLPPRPVDRVRAPQAQARFPSASSDPTPLVEAIWRGDATEVERLLAGGASPDARWGGGDRFPLMEAIVPHNRGPQRERDRIVRLLLAHKADPNQRFCPFESRASDGPETCMNGTAMTLLMAAARMNQWDVLYRLLDAGADPSAVNWFGSTALDYAETPFAYHLLLAAAFPGRDGERRAATDLLGRLHLRPPELLDALETRALMSPYYGSGWTYGRLRLLLSALAYTGTDPVRRTSVLTRALRTGVIEAGAGDVATLLVAAGADPNVRACPRTTSGNASDARCAPDTGTTLLMLAVSCGFGALERVLQGAADESLVDWEHRSAADYRRSRPLVSCGDRQRVLW